MSTTTFANAKAVKWNVVDGKAVYLGRTRIWPPASQSLQMPNDLHTSTGQEITAYVGDRLHLAAGSTTDWVDAYPALLLLQGGVQTGNYTPGPVGWTLQPVVMPDGSHSKAYVSPSHSADLDTAGMNPGTYQVLAPAFLDFSGCGVLLTIHLLPALVPPEIFLQLPDNPFTPGHRVQVVQVKRGQDVTLLFPKNPLGIDDDEHHPGWRHLTFIGWNPATNEAVDFVAGNEIQTDAKHGNSYDYHYINHGVRSVNRLDSTSFDMYSPIDIRMHMTDRINPGFWVVPVNGNYNTDEYDLQKDALFYLELH